MNNEDNNINQNNSVAQLVKDGNKKSKINIMLVITNIVTLVALIICIILYSPIFNRKAEEKTNIESKANYTKTATDKPVSDNWKDYQFSINGKTLTLPCSYNELKDISNFHMKSSDEKSYIEAYRKNGFLIYQTIDNDEKMAGNIDIKNTTSDDLLNSEGIITNIGQTNERYNMDVIEFPGKLKVGMEIRKEDIIEKFGEPSSIREYTYGSSTSIYIKYIDDENTSTINYYEIDILDGKIINLELDHYRVKE